jgi:phosphoglycerate kinase
MPFKTLRDFDLKGKRVLLRADLNVPAKDGAVTDTTRIDRLKPTIDFLTKAGAKTVVLSHFGRPKGGFEAEFSQEFLGPVCAKSWGQNVAFAKDCIGEEAAKAIAALKEGDIVLLENLRFHKGEEKNDPAFVAELAKLGDLYVNDAFSAAHRAHASTEGLARHLPTAAGFLMEAELNALSDALESPQKPVIAIVGGSKISTKLSVLDNLVKKVDYLFLGGGMANTFLVAQGVEVGKSLCERDMVDEAKKIMATAEKCGCEILLPLDRICVTTFGENAPFEIRATESMKAIEEAVDVGPATIEKLEDVLSGCKTALWNGPMGVFEVKPFDRGTNDLARAVAKLTKAGGLVSVAGGGDTVSALENAGAADSFTYISTAGGAFLEWLEGKELPGVAALTAAAKKAA